MKVTASLFASAFLVTIGYFGITEAAPVAGK